MSCPADRQAARGDQAEQRQRRDERPWELPVVDTADDRELGDGRVPRGIGGGQPHRLRPRCERRLDREAPALVDRDVADTLQGHGRTRLRAPGQACEEWPDRARERRVEVERGADRVAGDRAYDRKAHLAPVVDRHDLDRPSAGRPPIAEADFIEGQRRVRAVPTRFVAGRDGDADGGDDAALPCSRGQTLETPWRDIRPLLVIAQRGGEHEQPGAGEARKQGRPVARGGLLDGGSRLRELLEIDRVVAADLRDREGCRRAVAPPATRSGSQRRRRERQADVRIPAEPGRDQQTAPSFDGHRPDRARGQPGGRWSHRVDAARQDRAGQDQIGAAVVDHIAQPRARHPAREDVRVDRPDEEAPPFVVQALKIEIAPSRPGDTAVRARSGSAPRGDRHRTRRSGSQAPAHPDRGQPRGGCRARRRSGAGRRSPGR